MEKLPEIERAYRMRCYPTARQRRVLGRLFGASRFVWNWALERRSSAYRCEKTRLNWVALSREFTQLRHSPETGWLSELPREPFNQVLRDLERAYENFFARRAPLRSPGRRPCPARAMKDPAAPAIRRSRAAKPTAAERGHALRLTVMRADMSTGVYCRCNRHSNTRTPR